MAKNLISGSNIVIQENGDNIYPDLSSNYSTNLIQTVNTIVDTKISEIRDIYSTEEIEVGLWGDQKVYRKKFSGTFTTSSSRTNVTLLSGISKVVDTKGAWSPNSSTPTISISSPMLSTNGGVDAYAQITVTSTNDLRLQVYSSTYSGQTGSYDIAIDYIKASS